MFQVYILRSPSLGSYYIGQSEDLKNRIALHEGKTFTRSFTKRASDWELFHVIDCASRKQAVNIESHIKKMKSKKYVENLKKYPEISEKLKVKYNQ